MGTYTQVACTGKQGLTEERARVVAKLMRRRNRSESSAVSAYRCASCGAWHVGSTPPARRKAPKQTLLQQKAKDQKRLDKADKRQEGRWIRGSRG